MFRLVMSEDSLVYSDALVNGIRRGIFEILTEVNAQLPKQFFLDRFDEVFAEFKATRRARFLSQCAKRLRIATDSLSDGSAEGESFVCVGGQLPAGAGRCKELLQTVADTMMGYDRSGFTSDAGMVDKYNWRIPLQFDVELRDDVVESMPDVKLSIMTSGFISKLLGGDVDLSDSPKSSRPQVADYLAFTPSRKSKALHEINRRLSTLLSQWESEALASPLGRVKIRILAQCNKEIDDSKDWHGNETKHASHIQANLIEELGYKTRAMGWEHPVIAVDYSAF